MNSWKAEFRDLLKLAGPVVVVQLGLMSMGLVDALMVGRLQNEVTPGAAMAQVAIGHSYVWFWVSFAMGALMAIDPVVSQAVGAKDPPAIARALRRGLILATGYTLIVAAPLVLAHPILEGLGLDPDIVGGAATYSAISALGILPLLGFVVFRQTLQAMNILAPTVIAVLIANAANIGLNRIFVYGELGLPRLESAGTAWATMCVRWLMAGLLLYCARQHLWPLLCGTVERVWNRVALMRMLRLGFAIGVQYQLEIGVFAATAAAVGTISVEATGGHMIALQLAALSFMIPVGISGAVSVRVGQAIGRGDLEAMRRTAWLSLALGVGVMGVFSVLFHLFPETLGRPFSDKANVLAVAATLIPLAGVFQVFDGIQVVAIGILRGLGDTKTPAVTAIIGFWVIAFPLGQYLGFHKGMGAVGLWWGLVTGLAVVAAILFERVRRHLKHNHLRIVIDDEIPSPPSSGS